MLPACRTGGPHEEPPAAADAAPRQLVADGAPLIELYADDRFFEGPVWHPAEQKLYFTAFGSEGQQILRLEAPNQVHVWWDGTEGVNGMFWGQDGRLLGAQAYGHRVLALMPGGDQPAQIDVLAENQNWNQPNDVCQAPNGDIYFTDPDFAERTASAVYRLADGVVTEVVNDMAIPNGLIVSNDGATLYVADSFRKHWRAYPLGKDGVVGDGRVFFDPAVGDQSDPDGMTIDEHGNLYFTGRGGIWIVAPEGEKKAFVPVPVFASNVTFGGADGQTLFITGKGKVYALRMNISGGPAAGNWNGASR